MMDTNLSSLAASDYRSSNQEAPATVQQLNMEATNNENSTDLSSQRSYVTAAKTTLKPVFPKREQAVIMHSEEGLKIFDYVRAIGNIVGPKNVTFASRISKSRVCIYLASKSLVDQLIGNHTTIIVGDMELAVRRLVTPSKRIILSNLSPSIPHETVENELKRLGLNLVSPISFLKAGIPGDEYGHILSFRRQAYISPPEDNYELQTSILMPCEDRFCRVFISTDKMECFICKQPGHKANGCPNASATYSALQTDEDKPLALPETDLSPVSLFSQPNLELQTQDEFSGRKRGHETGTPASTDKGSLSFTESHDMLPPQSSSGRSNQKTKLKVQKPAAKKPKKDSPGDKFLPRQSRQVIQEMYEKNPDSFTIRQENFIAFIENTYNCNDPYSEALRFTPNVKALLKDMYRIYPNLKERSLKNRFTRISKKIKANLRLEGDDAESLTSLTSLSSLDDFAEDLPSEDAPRLC